MDVSDREEEFRHFSADEIRRQTVALEKIAVMSERTARATDTIRTIIVLLLCLGVLGVVASVIGLAASSSP